MIRRDPRHAVRPLSVENPPTSPVSSLAVLDVWASYDWSQGLDLSILPPGSAVEVLTMRSTYHIMTTGAGTASLHVRGGRYVPEFRRAGSIGSTLGGALLKQHMVHIGFKMELSFDDLRLITSPVIAIRPLEAKTD